MVRTSARGLFLLTSTVASAVLLRRLTRRSAASAVNRVFIFGLGYTGKRIAMQLKRQGWEVYGTVRTQESADRLRAAAGINAFAFDSADTTMQEALGSPAAKEALLSCGFILSTCQPDDCGDPVVGQLADLLPPIDPGSDAAPRRRWFGYLSSASVYGDHQSRVTTEAAELTVALAPLQRRHRRWHCRWREGRVRGLGSREWRRRPARP